MDAEGGVACSGLDTRGSFDESGSLAESSCAHRCMATGLSAHVAGHRTGPAGLTAHEERGRFQDNYIIKCPWHDMEIICAAPCLPQQCLEAAQVSVSPPEPRRKELVEVVAENIDCHALQQELAEFSFW